MGRTHAKEAEALKHLIEARITDKRFQELQRIISRNPNLNMSTLNRGHSGKPPH